jgi:hypothetical protein
MDHNLLSRIKDASLKRVVRKALSDDVKLSFDEVKDIVRSAMDGKGVTPQEFKDLKRILENAKTMDQRTKSLIASFLKENYTHPVIHMGGKKLTPNFALSEFACNDGTAVPKQLIPNVKELALNLQVLRDSLMTPIKINSAYRHPAYNARVGGAAQSQHLTAKAADIVVRGYMPGTVKARIQKLINDKKMKQGGLGLYRSFVHYDIRGAMVRW